MAEGLRNRRRPRRTPGRVAAAKRYTTWLNSPAWRRRRRRWAAEEQRRRGSIVCAVCSRPWRERRDDLHHASYTRMGRERHDDLIPMCRACHELVHKAIDASTAWQRLIAKGHRRLVTTSIIARLKDLKDNERERAQ